MKFTKYFLLIPFLLVISLILTVNIVGTRKNATEKISAENILKIKPRMTIDQVVSILGKPYFIEVGIPVHDLKCSQPKNHNGIPISIDTDITSIIDSIYDDSDYCCKSQMREMKLRNVTFIYTKPVLLAKYYPMLWVHFCNSEKLPDEVLLKNVFCKRYRPFHFDDYAIYDLNSGLFQKELFNECFQ